MRCAGSSIQSRAVVVEEAMQLCEMARRIETNMKSKEWHFASGGLAEESESAIYHDAHREPVFPCNIII
jgi:hypothetical protein